MSQWQTRLGLLLVFGAALLPLLGGWAQNGKGNDKNAFYTGKVTPLADILKKSGTKIDADAASLTLVLQADDGKLYPLLKDEGSRMFYKDAKLLNRPMRLTARLVPNSSFLQVIAVHSVVKGKLHDVYYWCEICVIKAYEDGPCACCGDAMIFREEPYKGD
jgi:hypothetical protein